MGVEDLEAGGQRHGFVGDRPPSVDEMAGFDAGFDGRGVAAPLVDAGKGVGPFHQQLEQQHRQTEAIVFGGAIEVPERLTLQFRRGEFGLPHRAAEGEPRLRVADLEGVGIHQSDDGGVADEDVGFVDVPDDVAPGVEVREGGGEVAGAAVQVEVVEQGFLFPAGFGGVEDVDGGGFHHPRHQVADDFLAGVRGPQQIDGPGDGDDPRGEGAVGRGGVVHQGEFVGVFVGGVVINFGDEGGVVQNCIDAALATAADGVLGVEGDFFSVELALQPHGVREWGDLADSPPQG